MEKKQKDGKTARQADTALADIEKNVAELRGIFHSLTDTGKLSTILAGKSSNARGKNILTGGSVTIKATRGPKKGKQRQLNVCRKCNWPWFSTPGKRPATCAACNDKNWDKPYEEGYAPSEEPVD